MTSYLDDRLAIDRLKDEYTKHKNLVIGYDFDSTIFDYHGKGLDLQPVIILLQQCTSLGFTMCLWTVPTEDLASMSITDKIKHCNSKKIAVDYVNSSPLFSYSKKAFFNILLDDRAGLSAAYNILRTTLVELNLILT